MEKLKFMYVLGHYEVTFHEMRRYLLIRQLTIRISLKDRMSQAFLEYLLFGPTSLPRAKKLTSATLAEPPFGIR